MSASVNRYRCDLRDMRFLLFEQFGLHELLGKGPYAEWAREDVEMILEGVYEWSKDVIGPLNRIGDQEGCTLAADGSVSTPTGFRDAYRSLYEAGWRGLGIEEEWGGQGGPLTLALLAGEMMSGANTAFNMYPGLTQGVFEVLASFGTPEQKERYLRRLADGSFAGTMCLTEPNAGSDVGANSTRATPLGDGRYRIDGTKIFISGGNHDLSDNILHLVLARTADAPPGTRGLSLFLVPRDRLEGGSNHVVCASLEHKMGISGSATAILNFGEGGECVGELVGTEERQGIKQMFKMMNLARIGVGIQGLAVAGSAYLNALEYARERVQGSGIKSWKDPTAPKVPIIEHANVRRMLLDMKSRVEGIRALIVKLAMHLDRLALLESEDEKTYHQGQVDLLVPLVKAYASDQGFAVTATAIQVFGGAGYLVDHPVEQYCRDSKIFSIYEGTNHIQALDLVGRKLAQRGGQNFRAFLKDVNDFVAAHRDQPVFGDCIAKLGAAAEALGNTAFQYLTWSQTGSFELVPLSANRFLEMMSQTAVAWLLLEAGIIAEEKAARLAEDHPDRAYYAGKRYAASYFANLELPRVVASAENLRVEDKSALDIPDAGFGSF